MISPGGLPDRAANGQESDVEISICGNRWIYRGGDPRLALALSQRLGVSELVGRILASRDVDLAGAERFLDPRLRDQLPDPSRFLDMDVAAERLASAIMQNEGIGVFGDYDVDGATSSALLQRFFGAAGGRCRVYIPDRMREGYGPNAPALLELKNAGVSVVVTVDCGTMAHEPLAVARDNGLDVIVVDHHIAETDLPPAVAVVNPNRFDEDRSFGQLAAVGVAFLLAVAVNRVLRGAGWYETRPEPQLTAFLDMVALGTVCDVVPLTGLNRALVVQGLKVLAARRNTGLRALADVAGVSETVGTYHLGFVLGPRINAGGRVGAADLGARLLASDDFDETMEIAHRLDGFNRERQAIEAAVLADAIEEVESGGTAGDPVVVAAGDGWHPGVIGIVAGRLKERYKRPACVVSFDDAQGTASGRSVPGVDLGAAIVAARQSGLLLKGGGHPMAAGFTIERARLADFRQFLTERVGAAMAGNLGVRTIRLDGALSPSGATKALIDEIERVGPFGPGNPEPRFMMPNVMIAHADVVGEDHLRVSIDNPAGPQLRAMAFRAMQTPLGPALLDGAGRRLHLAGKLRINRWQGREYPQLQIDDAAHP